MEGVMMKSPTGIAMAVRRADGNIVAEYKDFSTKAKKGTFWGLPIVRGCVAFVESLATGIKTTTQSANMYGADAFAEEEPTKFEKWLSKTFGKDIEDIVIGVALFLGILLAIGLFVFLPQLISSLLFGAVTVAVYSQQPSFSFVVFSASKRKAPALTVTEAPETAVTVTFIFCPSET